MVGGSSKRAGSGRNKGNYATLHNISQSKKAKREEVKKKGAGAGIARYGRGEVSTLLSPPSQLLYKSNANRPVI